MSDLNLFLFAAAASFAVSAGSIPFLMRLARALNIVDKPAHRKIHKKTTPYLGGIAILLGFCASVALFFFGELHPAEAAKVLAIAGASTLAFLIGLLDDKFKLRARYKLLCQIAVALLFILFGYEFEVLTLPGLGQFNLYYLGMPLTLLWILSVMNATNLIDGADGLAASVAVSAFGIIALMAFYIQDRAVTVLAIGGLFATLGFLVFNWHPARIYMGDTGSLGLGMILAGCLLSLGKDLQMPLIKAYLLRSPGEPLLYQLPLATAVVAYPFLELTVTVLRRLMQGKPIGSADKGHLHHRLMNRGWGANQICLAAVFTTLVAGGAAMYSIFQSRGVAAWFLAAGGLIAGMYMHFCGLLDLLRPQDIFGARPFFLLANHFISMQRIKLDYAKDVSELNALLAQTCVEFGVERFTLTVAAGKNQAEPSIFAWRRPAEAQSTMLPQDPGQLGEDQDRFQDQVELGNSATRCEWTFESVTAEEDIDIEYRVLISEFMRKALDKAEALYQPLDPAELRAALCCQRAMNSTQLRRRSSGHRPILNVPEKRNPQPAADTDSPPAQARNV